MSRPTVLLAATLEWAGTARLPQAFSEAGFDVTVHAPAGRLVTRSRHVREAIDAPASLPDHLATLQQLMAQRRFDHHVACDEPLLYALAAMRDQPWTHPLLPTPSTGSYLDFVISKLIFPATCARAGLPVPATRIHTDPAQLLESAEAMGFPLVVKLARGYGGLEVRRVDTAQALLALLAGWPTGTPVVLQACVPGVPGACCALWVRGELKAWFAFHAIHTWPEAFSPSTTVRLVDRPGLEPMLQAIGRLSAFHGLGGVDFIEREDGGFVLTEQHARPIPQFVLAAEAGIDLALALRALVADRPAPAQRPRITGSTASAEIPLFPQEAYRMIGRGQVRALARWRTDPRYRRQLFRADDRPLFTATLRELRRWAGDTGNAPHALRGCYINLDRSTERRETMEAQLRRLGLPRITRLRATDGAGLTPRPGPLAPGEIGCFVSHLQAIEQLPPGTLGLVLEDDAVLCEQMAEVLLRVPREELLACDLVFLDCQPMATTENVLRLWQSLQHHLVPAGPEPAPHRRIDGVDLLEARGLYLWAALGYLVTPRGRGTLPALLREVLAAGPQEAFDTALHRLIHEGRLRAAVCAPFLATPRLECWEATTIAGRPQHAMGVVSAAMRHLLFAGDVSGAQDHAAAVRRAPLTADPALQLLGELMAQSFIAAAGGPPPRSA